jgi:hypothetical protein
MVRTIVCLCLISVLAAPAAQADCAASYEALRATLDKAGVTQAQFLATCLPPNSAKAGQQTGAALPPDADSTTGMLLRGLRLPGALASPFGSFAS